MAESGKAEREKARPPSAGNLKETEQIAQLMKTQGRELKLGVPEIMEGMGKMCETMPPKDKEGLLKNVAELLGQEDGKIHAYCEIGRISHAESELVAKLNESIEHQILEVAALSRLMTAEFEAMTGTLCVLPLDLLAKNAIRVLTGYNISLYPSKLAETLSEKTNRLDRINILNNLKNYILNLETIPK